MPLRSAGVAGLRGMLVIRYNGYAGIQMLVGGLVGLIVGLILFYASGTTADRAWNVGYVVGLSLAAALDLVTRFANFGRDGSGALISPDSGGFIWYVPLWVIGSVVLLIALS